MDRIGVSLLILIQLMGVLFLIWSQIKKYLSRKSGINQKPENKLNKHNNVFGQPNRAPNKVNARDME